MDALTAWFEAIDKASADGVGYAGTIAITKAETKGNEIRLVGYAGTSELDRHEDVVAHGAYQKHLRSYLEVNPQVLWQHDHDEPIGRAVEARETDQGLHVVDVIPASGDLTPTQQKAVTLIRQGLIRTLSIGAIVHGREWVEGTEAQAKGVDSFRRLTDLELVEHSLVTIPANRGATFQVVASLGGTLAECDLCGKRARLEWTQNRDGSVSHACSGCAVKGASRSVQVPVTFAVDVFKGAPALRYVDKAAPDMGELAQSLKGLASSLTEAAGKANEIAASLGGDPQQQDAPPQDGADAQAFWSALGVTG